MALVDYGDTRVKCFTKAGVAVGTFGKQGHGPWEVDGLTGIIAAADGSLWIGDRGNARAYRLDRSCKPIAQVTLPTSPTRVFGLPYGGMFLAGALDSAPSIVDSIRRPAKRSLELIPAAARAHLLMREDFDVAAMPDGGFVLAYLYGSWLALYDRHGSVKAIPAPDGQEFPPPRRWKVTAKVARVGAGPSTRRVANDIATDGDRLFVLSVTHGRADGEVSSPTADDYGDQVDVYSVREARYVETWRLPRPATAIAWAAGQMLLLSRSPEPVITWWRMR